MCECGCTMMGERYTLPAPNGQTYLVSLFPGCGHCDIPPSVRIVLVSEGSALQEQVEHHSAPLPMGRVDGDMECSIYLGPTRSGFRNVMGKATDGWVTDRRPRLDRIDGEVMADDVWDQHLKRAPEIRFPATVPTRGPVVVGE